MGPEPEPAESATKATTKSLRRIQLTLTPQKSCAQDPETAPEAGPFTINAPNTSTPISQANSTPKTSTIHIFIPKNERMTPYHQTKTPSQENKSWFEGQKKIHNSLFQDTFEKDCREEFKSLIPDIVAHLHSGALLPDFMTFVRQIGNGMFPLNDFALLLVLEVARWFAVGTTNSMWYWTKTKVFWLVGLKLVHGSFIRFMEGGKSEG